MKKETIIIVIVALVLAILLILFYSFLNTPEEDNNPPTGNTQEEEPTEENPATTPEQEAGDVGEVTVKNNDTGEEEPVVNRETPSEIFNTIGEIVTKGDNYIVIKSSNNFADQKEREVTCRFTSKTKVFNSDQSESYSGNDGLDHLSVGMKVLISSSENIRGKTEFNVKTINIASE